MIQSVSDEVMSVSSQIHSYAQNFINDQMNPNLTFILAEHIEFAIERFKKGIKFELPLYYVLVIQ